MLSNFLRKILSLLSFWSVNDLSHIQNKDEKILKIIEKKLNSIHFNKKYLKKTHNIFNKKILNLLKNRKLTNFLRENFIKKMFFVHNRLFILKALLEFHFHGEQKCKRGFEYSLGDKFFSFFHDHSNHFCEIEYFLECYLHNLPSYYLFQ